MSSAYKWFGPHVGALVLTPDLLETVEPYRVRPADYQGPPRFETGTPAFESLAGVIGAAAFMAETAGDETLAHEAALLARLEDGLAELPGVDVYSPTAGVERAPTVIFNVGELDPGDVATALARQQVSVWHGHSYALELIDALGLTERGGAVRASIVRYNDDDDIDRLLAAVGEITD
jgi:selenocysteine lyase/cysteine desulfurase